MRDRLAGTPLDLALSLAVAALALGIAALFIGASGVSPAEAGDAFVQGVFGGRFQIGSTLAAMIPLVLVALAWIVTFSADRLHVGFPGQIVIGGLCSTVIALEVAPGLPGIVALPLAVLAGAAGGGLYAGIVAWLWAKRGANEILTSLLLNLIAVQVIAWMVRGPLQESAGSLPQTDPLTESAVWPTLLSNTPLAWDLVTVPIAIVLVAWVMSRTTLGFRLRLVGANQDLARQAGVSPVRVGVWAIVVSGALAGLAGASLVLAGNAAATTDSFEAGYGFTGIAVALLARNSPWGVVPAAFLFAALDTGGGVMEASVGVSNALSEITQGLVVTMVLISASLLYLRSRGRVNRIGRSSTAMEGT